MELAGRHIEPGRPEIFPNSVEHVWVTIFIMPFRIISISCGIGVASKGKLAIAVANYLPEGKAGVGGISRPCLVDKGSGILPVSCTGCQQEQACHEDIVLHRYLF